MTSVTSPPGKEQRHRMAVQRNRAVVFTAAVLVALVLRLLDVVEVDYVSIVLLGAIADLSALAIYEVHRRGLDARLAFPLEPVWLGLDAALMSWGVYLSGGADSVWFPWYVANISAAAFVLGPWAAFLTAVADTGGYLVAVWAHGDLEGFGPELYRALGLMTCLYVASFFFLRGIAELKRRRRTMERMRDDERRKVRELTRLTQELEERTREVAEANVRLTEADRLKREFLANMSHELRTPLNSIIGFSGILEGQLKDSLDERQARFLHYIHASGQHLLQIINDILDLSRIEAGSLQLNVERFAVGSVVEGISSVLADSARDRSVSIEVDVPADLPLVEADPVRLKQILYNLLSNAIKFSYEDSAVTVTARRLDAADSPLRRDSFSLAVRDEGIGIDPKDRELIFQEFYQVDGGTNREFEGTGLGLALVQRFAQMHSGVVRLESAVGQGSTFTVVLPISPPKDGEAWREGTGSFSGVISPGDAILVVEDDPTAYETIRDDLAEGGYQTFRARNAEEALRLARALKPIAITLDIILPGPDGWEVLRELKADAGTRSIPVIIISMVENRELGLTLGADDYFVKPPERRQLVRRLHELLAPHAPVCPRVLLVDDDPRIHDVVGESLDSEEFELLSARSGEEGMRAAREERPDVVLLDLMMEGLDGFEVATSLKEDPATAGIPIVVLTAKDMTPDDRARLSGKIEALLKKGERTTGRLASVIRDLVRRRARERNENA